MKDDEDELPPVAQEKIADEADPDLSDPLKLVALSMEVRHACDRFFESRGMPYGFIDIFGQARYASKHKRRAHEAKHKRKPKP